MMTNILIQNVTKQEIEELISKTVKEALNNLETAFQETSNRQADKLMTKKEAAKYLQVSSPTLSKYVKEGFIKAHSVAGTRLRFRQSDLDKALRSLRRSM